jgi:hypothetical protein
MTIAAAPSRAVRARPFTILLGPAVAGAFICLVATRSNTGIDNDSQAYLGATHNLLAGRGLTTPFDLLTSTLSPGRVASFKGAVPLTHFPPLYPLLLTGIAKLGPSPLTSARYLNAGLFALNLLLIGLLVLRLTSLRATRLAVATIVLMMVAPVAFQSFGQRANWLYLHSFVFSEPLFFALTFGSLLVLSAGLRDGNSRYVLAAATLASAAALARFVGVSVVLAVVILVATSSTFAVPDRVKLCVATVLIGLVPAAVASFYTITILHGESPRQLSSHPGGHTIGRFLSQDSKWVLPGSIPDVAREILVGALIIAFAVSWSRVNRRRADLRSSAEARTALRVLVVFALCYAPTVVLSRDFLDVSVPIDSRLLSPLQPVLYLVLIALAFPVVQALIPAGPNVLARAVTATTALVLAVALIGIAPTVRFVNRGPIDVAQTRFGPIVRDIRSLPRGTVVYTDLPGFVWQYTGRRAVRLPVRNNPLTNQPNWHYPRDLIELITLLRKPGAVVLIFPHFLSSVTSPNEILQFIPMTLVDTYPPGGSLWERVVPAH